MLYLWPFLGIYTKIGNGSCSLNRRKQRDNEALHPRSWAIAINAFIAASTTSLSVGTLEAKVESFGATIGRGNTKFLKSVYQSMV